MPLLKNDSYLGVFLLLALPMSLMAFGGPPLMYWNEVTPNAISTADDSDISQYGYIDDEKWGPANSRLESLLNLKKMPEVQKRGTWFLKNLGAKHMGEEKRSGATFSLVTFPCSRKNAYCGNGGRGPKLTQTRKGVLCACLCPYGYELPNCLKQWWVQ